MEQTAAHTDYFRGGVGRCHIHAQTHGIQHTEHPARHHAYRREHILLLFQQAHKDKAHQTAAGHGRRTERTDGRILRHAGTAGGAVFREFEPDKDHYLAQTQAYFFIGNLMMTMARAYNGFFTTSVAMGYVYGIVGVVIGNMMGAWVFRHITGSLLKYIIYAYIGISGLTFLLES